MSQIRSKLIIRTKRGGHKKFHLFNIRAEMSPYIWDNYIFCHNSKEFNGQKLQIGISKNGNKYWVNSGENTYCPVSFIESVWNKKKSFTEHDLESGIIYAWDIVHLSYTRDIGALKIKVFLRWRAPGDRHWQRYK